MLQCCFDVGYTFGFDETVFKALSDVSALEREHGLKPFVVEAKDPPNSIQLPFGRALRIDFKNLEKEPVWEDWHLAAQQAAHESVSEMTETNRLTGPQDDLLKQMIAHPPQPTLSILLYATGIAFVSLDFDFRSLPKENWRLVEPFYRAYEWGGYHLKTGRHLHDATFDIVKHLEKVIGTEFMLTRRKRLPVYRDDEGHQLSDIIPSFSAVIVANGKEPVTAKDLGFTPEVPETFNFEEGGTLQFDWAFCIAKLSHASNPHNFNAETALYLLRIAYVIEHTISSYDILFRQQLQKAAREALEDNKHPLEDVRRLVTIGHSIVGWSEPDNLTVQATQRKFFDKFEEVARLQSKRQRIKENAAALLAYREAEEARIQDSKDRRLNLAVFALTGLTLCSVAADFLGEITFPQTRIENALTALSTKGMAAAWLRRSVYIALIVLPCLVAMYIFIRRTPNRRVRERTNRRPAK